MQQPEYLQQYEDNLQRDLQQMLASQGELPAGPLPQTPDITDLWHSLAPSYCADAVKEIAQYPLVALGWAMYTGMAMAKYWDDDWTTYSHHPNLYEHVRDIRGFDYLDEVVREDLYGYRHGTKAFDDCESLVRSCAQMANDRIRHEQIEPSTPPRLPRLRPQHQGALSPRCRPRPPPPRLQDGKTLTPIHKHFKFYIYESTPKSQNQKLSTLLHFLI